MSTPVKIEALQDFHMTLEELQSEVDALVDRYGLDSIISVDGSSGYVSVYVQPVGDADDSSTA